VSVRWLELKIPPPAVALLVAAGMWFVASGDARLMERTMAMAAALTLAAIGAAFDVAGMLSFRRARTTINPLRPDTASALVTAGVYRVTRNPMYVGMLFLLLAWAAYLSSAWALVGPVVFLAYITRFQIVPEERVLSGLFGGAYADYRTRVRRWL